ncbi:MAG TPA: (2Fe-2S)-binding protein [Chloroflexaceae bacterium]|nr:(2Fe-2S)-binding protein [Chloroflexaceae bacterium]
MIRLELNGEPRALQAEPAGTLLQALRDAAGLPSVREGCGEGYCGTCTVLVDGRPISSCLMLAGQAEGRAVTTVEGLGAAGELHPVQRAFVEHAAFQCAFCTPGFLLMVVALLAEHPAPDEAQIRAYLAGNLCRCGSYLNIVRAAQALL